MPTKADCFSLLQTHDEVYLIDLMPPFQVGMCLIPDSRYYRPVIASLVTQLPAGTGTRVEDSVD